MKFPDRMTVSAVALCIPALGLCALGVWFLLSEVPGIANGQHRQALREYRMAAEEIAAKPAAADVAEIAEMPNLRRMPSKLKGGERWGHAEAEGDRSKHLVWIERSDGKRLGRLVANEEPVDLEIVFDIGISVALVVILLLTALSVRFLIVFAKARDDFLHAAVHDLTTPLAGMDLFIGLDDDVVRALRELMLRIIDNIRQFTCLGGKRPQPKNETFAIGEAYDLANVVYRSNYDGENPDPFAVGGDRTLRVRADKALTVQILWNLLGNDLKYAAPLGPIDVAFGQSGAFVFVRFTDRGPGMTAYERRHAFDRYYRARTVLKSGKGGFGIGLCTSREFARDMGGDLTVRPSADGGSVFELTLPGGATLGKEQ